MNDAAEVKQSIAAGLALSITDEIRITERLKYAKSGATS